MPSLKLITLLFLFSMLIHAQNELVPVNHPVYDLLRTLSYKSFIAGYDAAIIPFHRKEIATFLDDAKKSNPKISSVEMEEIEHWINIFSDQKKEIPSLTKEMGFDIFEHFKEQNENYFYSTGDSSALFRLSAVLSLDYLKDDLGSASLFMYGASILLDYENFGLNVAATNGLQFGNRFTAMNDRRIRQSYTFNTTGLNNFDATYGHAYFFSDHFKFQIGRERVLWGNSAVNPFLLGSVTQLFDFVKFQFKWKSFSYDFLHGWLVQPTTSVFIDSTIGDVRNKNSKYVAINRISFSPLQNLRIGGNQIIIYANRGVELAYLSPFAFWESAQRSLGDLDNSFLVLDASYYPTSGLNLYSSFMIDDIHFDYITRDDGNFWQNRWAYQIGFNLTNPLLLQNLVLTSEYSVIRPYTLSHTGIGESFAYTNNSYPLGINMEPNSTLWSTKISYTPFKNGNVSLSFNNYLHGRNLYDNSGNLVENVGGSYFLSTTLQDDSIAVLLDGELEIKNSINLKFNYLLSYLWNFEFKFGMLTHKFKGKKQEDFLLLISLGYLFFH